MEYWAEKPMQVRAIKALAKGFDLRSDFRLKFEKRTSSNNERKVVFLRALIIKVDFFLTNGWIERRDLGSRDHERVGRLNFPI